jgi:hypothetical protein
MNGIEITMNKATILLSFYIIGSSLVVYMTSKSFLWVIVLNVCFLLIWVIATYGFKVFRKKNETGDENKTKAMVCPVCNGKGYVDESKMECTGGWSEND